MGETDGVWQRLVETHDVLWFANAWVRVGIRHSFLGTDIGRCLLMYKLVHAREGAVRSRGNAGLPLVQSGSSSVMSSAKVG